MAENTTQTRKLNLKQHQFIEEYMVDFNGTQAAIRAGYAPAAARRHASYLMTNPHIKEAIEKKMEAKAKQCKKKAEDLLARLAAVMDDDSEKTADQLKAIEMYGKHIGMWDKDADPDGKVDWRELVNALREQGLDIKNQYLRVRTGRHLEN